MALKRNRELEEQWEKEKNDSDLSLKRVENVKLAREKNELPDERHLGRVLKTSISILNF